MKRYTKINEKMYMETDRKMKTNKKNKKKTKLIMDWKTKTNSKMNLKQT